MRLRWKGPRRYGPLGGGFRKRRWRTVPQPRATPTSSVGKPTQNIKRIARGDATGALLGHSVRCIGHRAPALGDRDSEGLFLFAEPGDLPSHVPAVFGQ